MGLRRGSPKCHTRSCRRLCPCSVAAGSNEWSCLVIVSGRAQDHYTYDRRGRTPWQPTPAELAADPDATQSGLRVSGAAKLQAVYEYEPGQGRVHWFRWNVTPKGNIGDYP